MKTRYLILLIILLAYMLYWMVTTQQDALAACKSAGVQSNATCEANI